MRKCLSYPVFLKAREVTFKILHDICPSNHSVHERFSWDKNSCGFCERDTETVEHVFFQCEPEHDFSTAFKAGFVLKIQCCTLCYIS